MKIHTRAEEAEEEAKNQFKEIDLRSGYIFFFFLSFSFAISSSRSIQYTIFLFFIAVIVVVIFVVVVVVAVAYFLIFTKHAPIPTKSKNAPNSFISLALNFPHFLEDTLWMDTRTEGYSHKFYVNVHNIKSNQNQPSHRMKESDRESEREILMHPINKFSSAFSQSKWRIHI